MRIDREVSRSKRKTGASIDHLHYGRLVLPRVQTFYVPDMMVLLDRSTTTTIATSIKSASKTGR